MGLGDPASCSAIHEEMSSAAIEDLETETRVLAELMHVEQVCHATILWWYLWRSKKGFEKAPGC